MYDGYYESSFYLDHRFLPIYKNIDCEIDNGILTISDSGNVGGDGGTSTPPVPKIIQTLQFSYDNNWLVNFGADIESNFTDYNLISGYHNYDFLRTSIPGGICIVVFYNDGTKTIDTSGDYCQYSRPYQGHSKPFFSNVKDLFIFNNDYEYTNYNIEEYPNIYFGDKYYDTTPFENRIIVDTYLYFARISDIDFGSSTVNYPVELKNYVYKYIIHIEFSSGFNKLCHPYARGRISGMASGLELNDSGELVRIGNTSILIDDEYCSLEYNKIDLITTSFGVSTEQDRVNLFELALMCLFDGVREIKTLQFDVTDYFTAQPCGGIIVIKDIEI